MELLSVRDLCKTYPGFTLDHVSFSLESGYIMGFIGRNGAGKTTTLKSMLGLVHPDGGTVEMVGMDLGENESACRQQIGVVLGDARYYGSKRLRDVAETTARVYEHWDDAAYREYMKRFSLDETKRVRELSTGMWVKFTLALALSHGARLLLHLIIETCSVRAVTSFWTFSATRSRTGSAVFCSPRILYPISRSAPTLSPTSTTERSSQAPTATPLPTLTAR